MEKQKWSARNKSELIIEVWEQLDCESVGVFELESIQVAIRDRFGEGAVESPATIARLLAEEGAVLRHPEVLDFDSSWREGIISGEPVGLDFNTLAEAVRSMAQLEIWRKESEAKHDETRLRLIREVITDATADLLFISSNPASTQQAQAEAREIAQWLS